MACCIARAHAVLAAEDAPEIPTPAEPAPAFAEALPEPAPAIDPQAAEAEQCRQRALRFYDSGNFAAAREEFLRAQRLLPSFRLLYNLGVVSMALGDSASAYDYFDRYLSQGGDEIPSETRTEI